MAKTKKVAEKEIFFFFEVDQNGDTTGCIQLSEDDVKSYGDGGDTYYQVKVIKKFKLVDESFKLIEIK